MLAESAVRGLNIPNRITPAEAEGFVGNSRALAEEEAFREFLEREVSERASGLGGQESEEGTPGPLRLMFYRCWFFFRARICVRVCVCVCVCMCVCYF